MSKELTVRASRGMVNIDAEWINYGNIRNMYTVGDGHGIQVNDGIDSEKAKKICAQIADLIYELQDMVD